MNQTALEGEFSKIIQAAWADWSVITGSSEPNHVARLIYGCPEKMAAAIMRLPPVTSATVHGVFCHRKPYVFWQSGPEVVRRELADLLVVVTVNGLERALLIQAKMGKPTASSKGQTLRIVDLEQRHLYVSLPEFFVELKGRPTALKVRTRKRTGSVSSYIANGGSLVGVALDPFIPCPPLPSPPVGLAYAAADEMPAPSALGKAPWCIERGYPKMVTSADVLDFDVPLAAALAEMVVAKVPQFGIDLCMLKSWETLIRDLQAMAHSAYVGPVKGHQHDVTFATTSSSKGMPSASSVFDHIAFMGNNVSFLSKRAATFSGLEDFWDDVYWTQVSRSLRTAKPHRPSFDRPITIEDEDAGFGVLEITVEVDPRILTSPTEVPFG